MGRNPKNSRKFLPKPSLNPSQTHLRKKMRPRHTPKSIFLAFWTILVNFWRAQGLPKSSQNLEKSEKKRWKIEVKKTTCFQHNFFSIFLNFGVQKQNQNQALFANFSKKSMLWKLAKTIEKTMVFNDVSVFKPLKIYLKSM